MNHFNFEWCENGCEKVRFGDLTIYIYCFQAIVYLQRQDECRLVLISKSDITDKYYLALGK